MKRNILLLSASLFFATNVFAATATPAKQDVTPSPTPKLNQIQNLKERLATKVAELRQLQKKAIFGTVSTTSVSTVTVETKTSDVKIELTDNIRVFQMIRGKRTQLSTDDVSKGDLVVVFGQYDTGLDLLQANVIFIQSAPKQRVSGTVTELDKKQYTITLQSPEGQLYIIDVESGSESSALDAEKNIVKGGFSKIQIGDTIHVVGTPVPKKDRRMSADRILDVGNLSGTTPTPTPTLEASSSASSSPTPKTKTTPKPSPSPTAP